MPELTPFLEYDMALISISKFDTDISPMEQQQIELLISMTEDYIIGYIGSDPRLNPDDYPDCRPLSVSAIRLFSAWYAEMVNQSISIQEQSSNGITVKLKSDATTDKLSHQIMARYAISIM